MNIDTIKTILEGIGAFGLLIAGAGYCYGQFSTGKNKATKDSIETENELTRFRKEQIEDYKEIVKAQDIKIAEFGKEIASMKAKLEEKEATIAKYLEILQNRNPELEQFMKESREKWTIQIQTITQIVDFMRIINEHLKK